MVYISWYFLLAGYVPDSSLQSSCQLYNLTKLTTIVRETS